MRTAMILALCSATALYAGETYSGSGGSIPDGMGQIFESTITVPESFSIADLNVTLVDFDHIWVGDISVRLRRAGEAEAVLVWRIGQVNMPSNTGDPTWWMGDYTFDSDSTQSIWAVSDSLGFDDPIPSGTYYTSGELMSGVNNFSLDQYIEQDAAGDWILTVQDHLQDFPGTLGSWQLEFTPLIPCGDCADANCDGAITVSDIGFFVAAVANGELGWNAAFAGGSAPCDFSCANDINGDGAVTVSDIGDFVGAVMSGGCIK